jgi:AraC family transcriptional regulator of adaptative response/methylated-DNA-[protein]-cysteine methyltransferase
MNIAIPLTVTTAPAIATSSADEGDYAIIRAAIEFISENWREQPSLEAIAARVAMPPLALQRLFTRWAGLTPKGCGR